VANINIATMDISLFNLDWLGAVAGHVLGSAFARS
jgi:hypothetical protein